jgi:hypothetical protein
MDYPSIQHRRVAQHVVGIPHGPHRIIESTRLSNPHYTKIMTIYCLTH